MRLVNNLNEETITHWHGLLVDYQNDGGPLLGIGPGQFYDYNFQVRQRAGLNFYHPHPHMLTGKQVCLGLAGAFIVRDAEEDALNLPSAPFEVPLIIRDASFDRPRQLRRSTWEWASDSICSLISVRCPPGKASPCAASPPDGTWCSSLAPVYRAPSMHHRRSCRPSRA